MLRATTGSTLASCSSAEPVAQRVSPTAITCAPRAIAGTTISVGRCPAASMITRSSLRTGGSRCGTSIGAATRQGRRRRAISGKRSTALRRVVKLPCTISPNSSWVWTSVTRIRARVALPAADRASSARSERNRASRARNSATNRVNVGPSWPARAGFSARSSSNTVVHQANSSSAATTSAPTDRSVRSASSPPRPRCARLRSSAVRSGKVSRAARSASSRPSRVSTSAQGSAARSVPSGPAASWPPSVADTASRSAATSR